MTAVVSPALTGAAPPTGRRFLGLRNILRKDAGEWLHGRRALVVLIVSTLWFAGTASSAWITDWVIHHLPAGPGETPPQPLPLDPLTNLLAAAGSSFSVIVAVFATMSLLIDDREQGTLAWTVSKPVSRTSVVLSSWLSSAVALGVLAAALPIAIVACLVTVLYGAPPIGAVIVLAVGLGAAGALATAVAIAAATVATSQAAVAAIGLAVLFVPSLLTGVVPAIGPYVPTGILGWSVGLAAGAPVGVITPTAWLVGLVGLLAFARWRFARMDL